MPTLRRLFSRLSYKRLLALFLLVVVPGALVVPLCYGIYGALRLTLAGKGAAREAATPEDASTFAQSAARNPELADAAPAHTS